MSVLSEMNGFVQNHQALVVAVGIPVLTLLVTVLTSRSMERRSAADRKTERELQRKLKLADFRRDWIEELRKELAEYNALIGEGTIEAKDLGRLRYLSGIVQMKVNPEDAQAVKLKEEMAGLMGLLRLKDLEDGRSGIADIRESYCETARVFLKAEWERLNFDLEQVEDAFRR